MPTLFDFNSEAIYSLFIQQINFNDCRLPQINAIKSNENISCKLFKIIFQTVDR